MNIRFNNKHNIQTYEYTKLSRMALRRIFKAAEYFENPDHPLLGPNIKGLYFIGYLENGSKLLNFTYNFIYCLCTLIVVSEYVELYQLRRDLSQALVNFSITSLSTVTLSKIILFLPMRSKWMHLLNLISNEEISAIEKNDSRTVKIMNGYKKYSRVITYLFWAVAFCTNIVAITSPVLKYLSMAQYREKIANGTEPLPQILSSWVPFNKNKMPGYLGSLAIHVFVLTVGSCAVAVYDTNAVTLMTFLKGQAKILKYKCRRVFGEKDLTSDEEVLSRISECYRHHEFIKNVYEQVNSLLSPAMFIYVLVCSISICCSVVQLSLDVTPVQKLWVVEYTIVQAFQLFLYCWHSNEVALETDAISSGCFESKWWRSNLKQRKLLVLLIGKTNQRYILTAGPFTTLSVPTFIDIIKGSYSFYTLVMQMGDN